MLTWIKKFTLPIPNAKYALYGLGVVFLAQGMALALLKKAEPAEFYFQIAEIIGYALGSALKGLLLVVFLWIVVKYGKRIQWRNAPSVVLFIGSIIYAIGCFSFLYGGGLFIYVLGIGISNNDVTPAMINACSFLAMTAFCYWLAGRAIKYVLGR